MAERELHERLCVNVDVVHHIALVTRVLGKLQKVVRQCHSHVCTGIDGDRVVTAERLETGRKQGEVHIGGNLVHARRESAERIGCGNVGVHECRLLAVAVDAVARIVEEDIAQTEVALHTHIGIAECGYRHIVLLVAVSRV